VKTHRNDWSGKEPGWRQVVTVVNYPGEKTSPEAPADPSLRRFRRLPRPAC
jgi:hypothetical protein